MLTADSALHQKSQHQGERSRSLLIAELPGGIYLIPQGSCLSTETVVREGSLHSDKKQWILEEVWVSWLHSPEEFLLIYLVTFFSCVAQQKPLLRKLEIEVEIRMK